MNHMQILEERVKTYLGEMELEPEQSGDQLYLFKYGSTVVMISLFEEGDQTFCRFASIMLKDFEPSLELLHRILRLNTEVLFGTFLLFEDNTLSFSATLLGNHLDFDEFEKWFWAEASSRALRPHSRQPPDPRGVLRRTAAAESGWTSSCSPRWRGRSGWRRRSR